MGTAGHENYKIITEDNRDLIIPGIDKSSLKLGTLEHFKQRIKKAPMDVVFAKNSQSSNKQKLNEKKKVIDPKKVLSINNGFGSLNANS